jgi:copper homeostasis protein
MTSKGSESEVAAMADRGQRLIEVVALHQADAESAQDGGADRIQVCTWVDDEPRSVEPAQVSAITRAVDLPVRVTLRLSGDFTTQGGEFTRLVGLAGDYLALGVDGLSFGFLTRELDIDAEVCRALADKIGDAPWTFDRAFDHSLDLRTAWRRVRDLPGMDGVHSAGALLGMDTGFDDLLAVCAEHPDFAATVVAAGGVRPEHLPWLVRAGVTKVHLGASVRPGGSWNKARVDASFVRSWRLLVDDALDGPVDARSEVG